MKKLMLIILLSVSLMGCNEKTKTIVIQSEPAKAVDDVEKIIDYSKRNISGKWMCVVIDNDNNYPSLKVYRTTSTITLIIKDDNGQLTGSFTKSGPILKVDELLWVDQMNKDVKGIKNQWGHYDIKLEGFFDGFNAVLYSEIEKKGIIHKRDFVFNLSYKTKNELMETELEGKRIYFYRRD